MNALTPLSSAAPCRQPGQRGAVLLVALLFSAAIAISLGSYLQVSRSTLELSHRALYQNAAMNLAETGLEEAMWSINGEAWNDWKVSGTDARRTLNDFDLGGGAKGRVDVVVRHYDGSAPPTVVARATVRPPRGNHLEKWIAVTLNRRSLFANGLVARNIITFSGNNSYVDSFDSRLGPYNAALGGGKFNRNDTGSIGSTSVQVDALSIGNADIWGFASVGTSDFSGIDVGPNGLVGPYGTADGVIDTNHVTTDFAANFDDVIAPTPTTVTPITSIVTAKNLPEAGDVAAADGIYYYSVGKIELSGNASQVLKIDKNVVFIMDSSTGTNIDLKGQASIQVSDGSSLTIYTDANVSIAGGGVANEGSPKDFFLYGTRPSSAVTKQTMSISGNGQLRAVVYAPSANLSMNGGGSSGEISGAIIGNNITVVGGSAFHYDVSLAELDDDGAFGITKWDELTSAAARNFYRALLTGS